MAGINQVTATAPTESKVENKNYTSALVVLTSLFFMWGFSTCMNDILIPYLKKVFELDYFRAMLVQFAFFMAYFIGSLFYYIISVRYFDPIAKIGYKNGILIGLVLSATGCFLFYPAALVNAYVLYLVALFVLALGFAFLQITANPYVAILGKPETSSSRLNLAQAFNSLGTTIAPAIGGYLIFKYFAGGEGSDAVTIPYMIFGSMFLALGILIKLSDLPSLTNDQTIEKGLVVFKNKHLVLGVIAIFMYVGGEVAIGSFLVNFFGLSNIAGLEEAEASKYVSFYWGSMLVGRFLGAISLSEIKNKATKYLTMAAISSVAFLMVWYFTETNIALFCLVFIVINLIAFFLGDSKPARTLALSAFFVVLLLVITIYTEGSIAMWSVISIGLFNSIMFPTIFTLAIKDLGKYTSQGSSLLIMAIVGGALVPLLQGYLADNVGVQNAFWVPVICYLYIAFYGLKGYKSN